jgi:hypothetical protein
MPGPDEPEQASLFGDDEDFHHAYKEWRGMPEYVNENLEPFASVLVHFATAEDRKQFEELVGQTVSGTTRKMASIWFPRKTVASYVDKRYRDAGREGG